MFRARKWVLVIGALMAFVFPPAGEPQTLWAQRGRKNLVDQTVDAFRLLNQARASGKQADYQRALAAWQAVLKRATGQGNQAIASLARHYVQEIQQMLQQLPQPQAKFTYDIAKDPRPSGRPRPRPKKVPQQDWNQFFKPGRKIHSLAIFRTDGQATNEFWILQGSVWFAHFAQTPIKVEILRQNGNVLDLEVAIPEIRQTLFVSRKRFNIKDKQILVILRKTLQDLVLDNLPPPAREAIRALIAILGNDMKRVADAIALRLAVLVGFVPDVQSEFRQLLDPLSGHVFEIRYVNGLGVTDVRIKKGEKLNEEYFRELARQLTYSALTNYLLRDLALAKPGQRKTYDVEELAGMLGFGMDVDAFGTVTLERKDDNEGRAVFKIIKADVTVEFFFNGRNHQGRFFVNPQVGSGVVYYRYDKNKPFAPTSWFVEEAYVDWGVTGVSVPPENLLFGVKRVHNLTVRSYFQAK